MKVIITGASGYLGQIISRELEADGHFVFPLRRHFLYGPVSELREEIKGIDALVHLAGAPLIKRWNKKNMQEIYDSRVVTTGNLQKAIQEMPPDKRPQKVCSASAIGIYAEGKSHDEWSQDFDDGFLGELVNDWEAAWNDMPEGVGLTIFRMAPVLGKESEMIKKLRLPFKLGLGGKTGSGKQPFPFVYEKDVARAYAWALENRANNGTFNLAAPQKISNKAFTKAVARQLDRPAFLTVPGWALTLGYGKAAGLLLKSPEVEPKKLVNAGFYFNYPTIEEVLQQIF